MDIKKLLRDMKPLTASDLYLKVGLRPNYRINGTLEPVEDHPPIEEIEIEEVLLSLLKRLPAPPL